MHSVGDVATAYRGIIVYISIHISWKINLVFFVFI